MVVTSAKDKRLLGYQQRIKITRILKDFRKDKQMLKNNCAKYMMDICDSGIEIHVIRTKRITRVKTRLESQKGNEMQHDIQNTTQEWERK